MITRTGGDELLLGDAAIEVKSTATFTLCKLVHLRSSLTGRDQPASDIESTELAESLQVCLSVLQLLHGADGGDHPTVDLVQNLGQRGVDGGESAKDTFVAGDALND